MSIKNIGVVIIGRNEGERLILCLESILAANVPCVYVDSQSKDNSVNEAAKRKVKTVVLDDSSPINASRARNVGFETLMAENTSLEYVHFIDADCELDPSWLKHAVDELESSEQVAIVCGRLREKHRSDSVYMRLCDMDWYVKPGEVASCGGIFTIRSRVFSQLDGFNTALIAGADPEFCFRVKNADLTILCLDVEMGTHDSAMMHFSQWWKRCVKVGYGYANGAKWGGWNKQYRSSLFWGGVLPLIIIIGAVFLSFYIALFAGVYLLQVARIYSKELDIGSTDKYDNYLYAKFCMLAKFPEAIGVLKYLRNKFQGRQQRIIEYKSK